MRGARAVSASESGESRRVDELTLPPPQPGRRARSSGRAVAITRTGTPLAHSPRCRRSRGGVVGPVEVFEDEDERPVACDRFQEAAPGSEPLARRSSPSWLPRISEPASGRGVARTQSASRRRRRTAATALASFVSRRPRRVGLEDPGLRLHDPRRTPRSSRLRRTGSERPWRQRRAPKSPVSIDRVKSSWTRRDFPDPGNSDERHEPRLALVRTPRVVRLAEHAQLLLAPDERGADRARSDIDAALGRARPPRPARGSTCLSPRPGRAPRSRSRVSVAR